MEYGIRRRELSDEHLNEDAGNFGLLKRKREPRTVEKDNYPELNDRSRATRTRRHPVSRQTSVNRFVRVQANSVILLISAPFFRGSFDPTRESVVQAPAALRHPRRPASISRIGGFTFLRYASHRQKPARMRRQRGPTG